MKKNDTWENYDEYKEYERIQKLHPAEMLKEFHTKFKAKRNENWHDSPDLEKLATKIIVEEFKEFIEENESLENVLGELADLVYVCYGYADRFGWDLDEALRRKHCANMSKLGADGEPIFREDGKILKGPNFKPADLGDLV